MAYLSPLDTYADEVTHGEVYESNPPMNVGDIGPDEKLVIDSWKNRYRTLDGSYGMMIWYDINKPNSKPRFQLFMQPQKKFKETDDLKEFLNWLTQIPKKSDIYYYDRCTGGTHYGLDPGIVQEIEIKLSQNEVKLLEPGNGGYIICTCTKSAP